MLFSYMVAFLTMLCFALGICFGVWKQAQAKFTWTVEALQFAAQAANVTGDIKEVRLNEGKARRYFETIMKQTVRDYTLKEFAAVDTGDPVPGGKALAPGYRVVVDVPVAVIDTPLISQKVVIPMRCYSAVTKSYQIRS